MSAIPPLYEGTPLRGDAFILTFAPFGTISVGNVVTLTSGASWTVAAATAQNQFLLGVSLTTGGLAGGAFSTSVGQAGQTPITVITRGIVDLVADATTINVGDFLVPSATTGSVHSVGSSPFSVTTGVTRAIALSPSTATGTIIQAFLF